MKKVLCWTYEILIFLPVLVISTIITAIVVMMGCLLTGNDKFWGYYPPMIWSKIVCRAALCRIKVTRKGTLDPDQSYVFVPNHQGAFDIFLIYGYLGHNVKWVQKKELRKIPFVGKASEIAGHVFVDQSNLKSMQETIVNAEKQLAKGVSMTIFPEGARTYAGKMGRFKRGAFIIAKEMGLPIVPVTVNGPFDVMKIHSYLVKPSKMELVIHEPIPTVGLSDKDILTLMDNSREIVYSGLWEKYK